MFLELAQGIQTVTRFDIILKTLAKKSIPKDDTGLVQLNGLLSQVEKERGLGDCPGKCCDRVLKTESASAMLADMETIYTWKENKAISDRVIQSSKFEEGFLGLA